MAVSMEEAAKEVMFGRFRPVKLTFRVAGVALRHFVTFEHVPSNCLGGRRVAMSTGAYGSLLEET